MEGLRNHNFIIPRPMKKSKRKMPEMLTYAKKHRRKFFRPPLLSRFSPHKCPKKPFSVFERRILPKAGENERTPFVFCPNPHHVQNPRLGTRFETVCGRFYTNLHVFPLSLLRLKRIVGPGKNATFRNALYLRHMVVVVKSARILRLSSIL